MSTIVRPAPPRPTNSWVATARRGRAIALWALVLVLAATVIALLQGGRADTYLDPEGTGPQGLRALVRVLQSQGVEVETSSSLDELHALRRKGPNDAPVTVALGAASLLTDSSARAILRELDADDLLVLLDGGPAVVRALDIGYLALPAAGTEETSPDCTVPETHGSLRTTRFALRFVPDTGPVADDVLRCYPLASDDGIDHGSLLLAIPATTDRPRIVALGVGPSFTNRFIVDGDNAALALRLLGSHERLIIHTPSITDVIRGSDGPPDAAAPPPWVVPGLLLIGLAVVAYAVAAGRRHGRLVPEPLPVVVKASETTHSRAELYRAAGDRARAAMTLRAGTLTRLRRHLRLAPSAPPSEVVAAAAARGIPLAEVGELLTGPAPDDDAGLVRLANDLTALEEKVT